jgi:PIN domain nuclease of toxin-antitoxin system
MKLLLDTHAALWLINEYEKLSSKASDLILDDNNELFLSVASLWEIAIKVSKGKLTELNGGVNTFITQIENMPIEFLPITPSQTIIIEKLPFLHKDPFDRIIIASAISENMTILTDDDDVQKYNVPSAW